MSHEYPFPGNQIEIPLSRELFLHDAIWFDRLSSKELSLINPKTGHGLATFFPDFETVAFWTSLSKMHITYALNHGMDLQYVLMKIMNFFIKIICRSLILMTQKIYHAVLYPLRTQNCQAFPAEPARRIISLMSSLKRFSV